MLQLADTPEVRLLTQRATFLRRGPSCAPQITWVTFDYLRTYAAMNGESLKDFSTHFRKLVAGELPKDSRILMPRGGGTLTIFATWRLPGDPSRSAQRSRMIRIAITQGALEDYAGGNIRVRRASNRRFVAWLRRQIAAFDPHQDSPLHIEPPPVTWPIGTRELNG